MKQAGKKIEEKLVKKDGRGLCNGERVREGDVRWVKME